jgi:hypothetical protein
MGTPQRIGTDDPEKIVLGNIAEFGWHAVNVIEDNGQPPWSYSIGLYESWQFPEIIIIGRSRAIAHLILSTIATDLDDNHRPDLNLPTDLVLPGAACLLLEVAARYYPDYVGFARWYYRRRHFTLYQIIWPNNDGHYPWDPRAPGTFKEWQPLLGEAPKSI